MDFACLKYFPFGGAKRLDLAAEFFTFNRANVSQINAVLVQLDADTRVSATDCRTAPANPVLVDFEF